MSDIRARITQARDQMRAGLAQLDAVLIALENGHAGVRGPCEHPVEQRIMAPRMGAPQAWVCRCGAEG